MNLIEFKSVTKTFGRFKAVDNLSFQIGQGCVCGILGPNGSGKTTTLNLLVSVLKPAQGEVRINPSMTTSQRIGFVPERMPLFDHFSALRNIKITALIKQVSEKEIEKQLAFVGLSDHAGKKVRTFSFGMRQRLSVAMALLGDPGILILDEPTNGLDPEGIVTVRDLILNLSEKGLTIIVASHLLSEIEKVCSKLIVIKGGRCIFDGDAHRLIGEYGDLESAYFRLTK